MKNYHIFQRQTIARKVALFYILQTSLIASSTEGSRLALSASASDLVWLHMSCHLWKTPLGTHERTRVKKCK